MITIKKPSFQCAPKLPPKFIKTVISQQSAKISYAFEKKKKYNIHINKKRILNTVNQKEVKLDFNFDFNFDFIKYFFPQSF